ncbi:hypothetical protein TDB9533_02090 [Thalassocella blandensis]|nr:hypothetical protein TDB9533_02090 [Thalassocella blandensis]
MNEVRTAQSVTPIKVDRSASSTGAENAKTKSAAGESNTAAITNVKEVEAVNGAGHSAQGAATGTVETAVTKVNDYVQSIQRNLHFSVDEDLEKTVVKVIDGSSGELIRQIPEEIFLELARKLNENGELQLMNALG